MNLRFGIVHGMLCVSFTVSEVKMKPEKIEAILRAMVVLNALMGEQGSYRLGEISQWSKVSRATCDRYLRKMTECGLLIQKEKRYRGEVCRAFEISKDGQEFYHQIY